MIKPVAVETKTSVKLFTDCISEMEDRLEKKKISDISSLPEIVLGIDNYESLMEKFPKEFIKRIQMLGTKAPEVGIHMIISTNRLSTGTVAKEILTNFPSKVAFRTMSGIDSRTLIDSLGSERLRGHGDMLFKPITAGIRRIQGSFISDNEIEQLTDFWRN